MFLNLSWLWITIISLWFLIFLAILVVVLRFFLHRKGARKAKHDQVVLMVRVPKESGKTSEDEKKDNKEIISIAEVFYTNLYGIKPINWWPRFWFGEHTLFSFEIVALNANLYFYLTVPQAQHDFLEQQLHAQYPAAQIDQVKDYNLFTPQAEISGARLALRRYDFFPIKNYKELETDPLKALTNVLSRLKEKEGAVIQILIKPAAKGWTKQGLKVATSMQQGKKLKEALGSTGLNKGLSQIAKGASGAISAGMGVDGALGSSGDPSQTQELHRLTPLEDEIVKNIEEKASSFAFETNIRILVSSELPGNAEFQLNNISNTFSQYDFGEKGNGFVRKKSKIDKLASSVIHRTFDDRNKFILNTAELTSLWHIPLSDTETPNIVWLASKRAAPPVNMPTEGILLGRNIFRGKETLVKMRRADRRRHTYMIGKSGSGKSVLLGNLIIQDIRNGEGVGLIDPHGDLVDRVLENIPPERVDDVVLFNPSDLERPIGLNMLEFDTEDQMDFVVQEMISIFYKLFPPEMIGPMFEHNMRNVMLTLMADRESPGTLTDIPRMFTDKNFQAYKLKFVKDPMVRSFWEQEMANTTDHTRSEMLGYLISKVGRFVENEMMRNIIGQPKSGINFTEVMDNQKILLINLSKGTTGEVNSSLLGLIFVAKLQMSVMARSKQAEDDRKDFYLYIDEFQNFVTDSISTILSEARKYRLCLILAHQYVSQLMKDGDVKIRDAVFGNVGTLLSYRVGVEDAEIIAKELAPVFNEFDVMNVEKYHAYIKLLIDNTASRPFHLLPFAPEDGSLEMATSLKQLSRLKFGVSRKVVEAEILRRSTQGAPPAQASPPAPEVSA